METITLAEAKATLSEVLRRVEKGEDVIITRRGLAVARVTRAGKAPRAFRSRSQHRARLPKTRRASATLIRQLRNAGY